MANIFSPLHSMLRAAEELIARAVLAAYTAWLSAARKMVMAPYDLYRASPDPSGIWAVDYLWDGRIDQLVRDLHEIARHGWVDATHNVGTNIPFDPSSPILADQLLRTKNLLVRTPHEVYLMVVNALAQGGSRAEQAQRVSDVLDVTGTENWPSRARTVATTEVHRAYAFGGLAAALKAQETLGVLNKTWDARRDSATRFGHRRAHGQTVPVSQPFEVAGESLMAPLDPAGSPENVINCRCRAEYSRSR